MALMYGNHTGCIAHRLPPHVRPDSASLPHTLYPSGTSTAPKSPQASQPPPAASVATLAPCLLFQKQSGVCGDDHCGSLQEHPGQRVASALLRAFYRGTVQHIHNISMILAYGAVERCNRVQSCATCLLHSVCMAPFDMKGVVPAVLSLSSKPSNMFMYNWTCKRRGVNARRGVNGRRQHRSQLLPLHRPRRHLRMVRVRSHCSMKRSQMLLGPALLAADHHKSSSRLVMWKTTQPVQSRRQRQRQHQRQHQHQQCLVYLYRQQQQTEQQQQQHKNQQPLQL